MTGGRHVCLKMVGNLRLMNSRAENIWSFELFKLYLMTIVDLIEDIRNADSMDDIYNKHSLDRNAEAIEVFLENGLTVDAQIHFISVEESEYKLVTKKREFQLISLFTINELFEKVKDNIALTNNEIAAGIINYRINDA